jgi:cell division protein FtsB
MNNKKSPSRTTRIIEAAIAIAVACVFVALLVPGIRSLHERRQQIQHLRRDVAAAERRIEDRRRQIQDLGTDEGIECAAREELHLVKPGEVIFVFEKEPPAPGERRP